MTVGFDARQLLVGRSFAGVEQRLACCSTPASVVGPLWPRFFAAAATEPSGAQLAVRAVSFAGLVAPIDAMPALVVGLAIEEPEFMPAPVVGVLPPATGVPLPPVSVSVTPAAPPATRSRTRATSIQPRLRRRVGRPPLPRGGPGTLG